MHTDNKFANSPGNNGEPGAQSQHIGQCLGGLSHFRDRIAHTLYRTTSYRDSECIAIFRQLTLSEGRTKSRTWWTYADQRLQQLL